MGIDLDGRAESPVTDDAQGTSLVERLFGDIGTLQLGEIDDRPRRRGDRDGEVLAAVTRWQYRDAVHA